MVDFEKIKNMDVLQIMDKLPHRYPFLMIDKVVDVSENKLVAQKNLTMNEEFFQGHFPGNPIMPGVLQIEALAQAAGIYGLSAVEGLNNGLVVFGAVDGVKFKSSVVPGDILTLDVRIEKLRSKLMKCSGRTMVGDRVATEVESMTLFLVEDDTKISKADVHTTAIVSPEAVLGKGVKIGPYAVVGSGAEIGDNTTIDSHAVIGAGTIIGKNNHIHYGAIIGDKPQDMKYADDQKTNVVIGDNNEIREYVTIHKATGMGKKTFIGNDNILMAMVHIGHNCVIGNEVTIVNMVQIAGHVVVEDQAVIGGQCGVPQFVRIGKLAMVGGYSRLFQDIPPFMLCEGNPADVHTINTVGLKRRGHAVDTIKAIKNAYILLYRSELNVSQALERIEKECLVNGVLPEEIVYLINFIKASNKGITRKKSSTELLQDEKAGLWETEPFFDKLKNSLTSRNK